MDLRRFRMTDVTAPADTQAIPLDDIAPYSILFALIAVLVVYFVGAEQTSAVHEWLHDGRHLLGFPCH
jgi:cobalt transporter subunit CbtB